MEVLRKAASVQSQPQVDEAELQLINQQALRTLTAEEVFVFRLAACDNQVDRDFERFTEAALAGLAKLYPGKPVLMDHKWSAGVQTARVYAAGVEQDGDVQRLILRCYMPRTEGNKEVVAAIKSGVLRECSVGVVVGKCVCSICGADNREALCKHFPGRTYDGVQCHFELDDARDVYEVSLVAVPAQREAGIIKSKRYGGADLPPEETSRPNQIQLAKARLELEKIRYGG